MLKIELTRPCTSRLAAAIVVIAINMPCALSAANMKLEYAGSLGPEPVPRLRIASFVGDSAVELIDGQTTCPITLGQRQGAWTFMGVVSGRHNYAVLEDFESQDGHILFVDTNGVQMDLPKSSESGLQNSGKLYLGHTPEEISGSTRDLLGNEILSRSGDPEFALIKDILPKHGNLPNGHDEANSNLLEGFVGTPDTREKIFFRLGGQAANFDPASLQASILKVRREGTFRQGLVGGYLPAIRFVYPETGGAWTEMIAFAPFRIINDNVEVQPVWYRVSRIENGTLKWSRYIDSYLPFPMNKDKAYKVENGQSFYTDFINFRERWNQILSAGMKISLPDKLVENMSRFSLVGSLMTRAGNFPKYGLPAEGPYTGYGESWADGFPDTFTEETDTMLDWGLLDQASRYIDNYLGKFVRNDGSLLYRGPETGQYGRMLATFANYLNIGGDPRILIENRGKIEGIVNLLLTMRADAKKLPRDDPAYGMLSGWSEADSSVKPGPSRYTQPYISNSTEAVRGFHDFGAAWQTLGRKTVDVSMTSLGERLTREAALLNQDVAAAISKTTLTIDGHQILPPIAGVRVPPDIALAQDEYDPQWVYYRVFMEMFRSGVLSADEIQSISNYLSNHHGLVLGMPSEFYAGKYLTYGFQSSGYGYSLVQADHIREALLLLYSEMAHLYTRGTWVAPEEREPMSPGWMRYSTTAQLTISSILRWLLVFQEPESDTLWLGKGIPTKWFEDRQRITVDEAPTRWGKISFSITSHTKAGIIQAQIVFPKEGLSAETKLRLRTDRAFKLKSVTVNGKSWSNFDSNAQVIEFRPGTAGTVSIVARN